MPTRLASDNGSGRNAFHRARPRLGLFSLLVTQICGVGSRKQRVEKHTVAPLLSFLRMKFQHELKLWMHRELSELTPPHEYGATSPSRIHTLLSTAGYDTPGLVAFRAGPCRVQVAPRSIASRPVASRPCQAAACTTCTTCTTCSVLYSTSTEKKTRGSLPSVSKAIVCFVLGRPGRPGQSGERDGGAGMGKGEEERGGDERTVKRRELRPRRKIFLPLISTRHNIFMHKEKPVSERCFPNNG